MAKVALTGFVIYDERMYQGRGHVVYDWGHRIERNFTMWAKEEAPIRSGELRAKISGSMVRTGVRALTTTIETAAPHSLYVIRGTTGPIYSRRMWGFRNKFPHLKYPRGGGLLSQFFGPPDLLALHGRGYALRVRAGKGFPERLAVSVSGQRANNFMGRAATRVAARHSSLAGFEPGINFW